MKQSWRQLDLLGRDQMKDFQELADEAFRDLLKKYDRPVDLKDALRRSAGVSATIHQLETRSRQETAAEITRAVAGDRQLIFIFALQYPGFAAGDFRAPGPEPGRIRFTNNEICQLPQADKPNFQVC